MSGWEQSTVCICNIKKLLTVPLESSLMKTFVKILLLSKLKILLRANNHHNPGFKSLICCSSTANYLHTIFQSLREKSQHCKTQKKLCSVHNTGHAYLWGKGKCLSIQFFLFSNIFHLKYYFFLMTLPCYNRLDTWSKYYRLESHAMNKP